MSVGKALFAASLLLQTSGGAVAQGLSHIGPISVGRFSILKKELGVPQRAGLSGYHGNDIYMSFVNLLVESVLRSDGIDFCLSGQTAEKATGIVFHQLVEPIEAALAEAKPDEGLRQAVVNRFAKSFPCPGG